jgi:hypothetical protein
MVIENGPMPDDTSGVAERGINTRVIIGGFDFGDSCQRIRIKNAVNSFPTVQIDLGLDANVGRQLDYPANVQVLIVHKEQYPVGAENLVRPGQQVARVGWSGGGLPGRIAE